MPPKAKRKRTVYKASEACAIIRNDIDIDDDDDDDSSLFDDEHVSDIESETDMESIAASDVEHMSDMETETQTDTDTADNGTETLTTTAHNQHPLQWGKTVTVHAEQFSPVNPLGVRNAGTIDDKTSAVDIFSLFADDSLLQILVDMTNLRAAQVKVQKPKDYCARQWTDLSLAELKAFLGVRLAMEQAVIKRRYEYYFSKQPGFLFETPGFRKVFKRDRFMAIWKFLHVVDEQDPLLNKADKLYKLRPILNHIVPMFQHFYVPSQCMSLDEGMIPAKNRLSIKQYIKMKPVKWGIKTFLLCESDSGYVYNIEVYTGKSDGLYVAEIGATGSVVARLTKCIENQNYHVYMDRFYNSPALTKYLLTRKIQSCGTVQVNRKGFPRAIQRSKKQMKRGESEFLCDGTTSAIVWCDRAPVYFISSIHDPRINTSVTRRNKDGTLSEVACPQLVSDYTKYMGGCDSNDQMTKLYRSRRHYRWPKRLMMKCFFWCLYNGFIIEKRCKPQMSAGHRPRTFYDFVDQVIMALIGDYRSPEAVHNRKGHSDIVHTRLINVGVHHPEHPLEATTNNTCAVCREKRYVYQRAHPEVSKKMNPHKLTKTVYRCSNCQVYLCIRKDSTCWKDYHTKIQYWR